MAKKGQVGTENNRIGPTRDNSGFIYLKILNNLFITFIFYKGF